jgi:hypothetical protein
LGFALADALGESGRSYYHRLSCFYPKYNQTETDKHFNNCLKAHGHGVTIKTLYHLAKQVGINLSTQSLNSVKSLHSFSEKSPNPQIAKYPNIHFGNLDKLAISEQTEDTELSPTFPEAVYQNLPEFLQRATAKSTSAEDKDLLLLGSLVAISPCLPNIYGIYAERKVFPNLFLFITASASAGKGHLTLCKELIYPIHRELIEQNKVAFEEYQRELNNYTLANKNDKREMERPQEPCTNVNHSGK